MAVEFETIDLIRVLEGLNDDQRPQYISDILFGHQRYPRIGSEDYKKIKLLEDFLIREGLVEITERGGTNKTISGFNVFIISSKGFSRLQELKASKKPPLRPLAALSIDAQDQDLLSIGLNNKGLLGFLEDKQSSGTFELAEYLLTFPRGQDYFYTLDTSEERFEGRSPINRGRLGFARKTPSTDFHQLFRFFNGLHQFHLYVINPNIETLTKFGFQEEPKNRIYIRRDNFDGDSIPLYFYSNQDEALFSPLAFDATQERDIEIEVGDKVEIGEAMSAVLTKRVFSRYDFAIGDSLETGAALGVEELADQVVKIVKKLKSEPGNMTGVFAQWGRGKTRLLNEIWKRLVKEKEGIEYIRIKYQAWKYQETPGTWAYLYEQFSQEFLGNKKGVKNYFKYHRRLLDLNLEREGWGNLILSICLGGFAVFGAWMVVQADFAYKEILKWISIPMLGALIGLGVKNFKLDYFTKAINLIKKYGVKTTFKESLGIQAEIQKELVHLVKAWVNDGSKRKLILMVDDLDRCSEEKTIEIIDALRIMLDDEAIKDKLIVITAIDERLLQLAVKNKYVHAHENLDADDLAREYIDKLFIFSLKLAPLSHNESEEFFEKLIENDRHEKKTPVQNTLISDKTSKQVQSKDSERNSSSKTSDDDDNSKENFKTEFEKIERLSDPEIEIFKSKLQYLKSPTPRKIRILYYRYLFVRNLLILKHNNENENCFWLQSPNHEILIQLLIHFSQSPIQQITSSRNGLFKSSLNLDELGVVPSDTKIETEQYLELFRVFELAIAY